MPARLRLLAWVHVLLGAAGLALFGVLLVSAALAGDPEYADEFAWMGGLLGILSLAVFLPMFAGGLGLLNGWPPARAVLWIETAVLAILVPVGTVLSGFTLWILLATRQVSADGGIAAFEGFVRRSVRTVVLILIALFILGVILGFGYVFRDVIAPTKKQVLTPLPSGVPDTGDLPRFEYAPPTLPRVPER